MTSFSFSRLHFPVSRAGRNDVPNSSQVIIRLLISSSVFIISSHSRQTWTRLFNCSRVSMCGTHNEHPRLIFKWSFRIRCKTVSKMFINFSKVRTDRCLSSRMTAGHRVDDFFRDYNGGGGSICESNSADSQPSEKLLCQRNIVALDKHSSL